MVQAGSLALIFLAFAAGGVTASAVTSRTHALSNLLKVRQSTLDPGDIPSQCQSVCTTFVTVLDNCQTDSSSCLQICTNTVMSSVSQCLSCSINAQGGDASLTEQGQEALEQLESSCAQAGEPVNSFTVSGATAVSTPASGSASASLSVPIVTGSSQSIFFSSGFSPSSASASGAASSASATAPVGTISKQTVTALSTSSATPAAGSTSASSVGALNPSATAGSTSGAAKTAAASVLGFLGAAVVFAVQL